MKLITQTELANQIGCSQQAVSKACKEGGPLKVALVDGRHLDAEHKAVIDYRDEKEAKAKLRKLKKKPRKKAKPKKKTKPKPVERQETEPTQEPVTEVVPAEQNIELYKTGDADIRSMADMTLDQLVRTFSTAAEFREWIKAVHELEKTHERRLKNMVKEGQLVSKKLIKQGIIDPMDEAWAKLLADGAKTLSIYMDSMSKSGRTQVEMEDYARETISKFVRPAKDRIARALGSMKGGLE